MRKVSEIELANVMNQLKRRLEDKPNNLHLVERYISDLEGELSEFKIRETCFETQVKELKEENEEVYRKLTTSEKELYKFAETIQQLKSENIDLMAELVHEREKGAAYKEDSDKMLEANKELRELLKEKDRKLTVFKNALKECLL